MRARARLLRCTAALAFLALLATAVLWWVARARSVLLAPRPTLLFEDAQGRFLAELSPDTQRNGYWPLPVAIPQKVRAATLAAEDARFDAHAGVDPRAVLRAVWQDARCLRVVSGASTIAMQVARLQHPAERNLWNKLLEAAAAIEMVRVNGRDAVLRHYLQIAPYGSGNYGVAYAARRYFSKPIGDLTWAEASLLAGLPKLPGRMNLYRYDGWYLASVRAKYVLARLAKLGWISDSEYAEALDQLPLLRPSEKPARPVECLHAILQIEKDLHAHPSAWSEFSRPIVRTSIDMDVQNDVSDLAAMAMRDLRRAGAGNVAVIVAERDSGNVVAYLGSEDYRDRDNKGAIDYAQVSRSSGSTLKPFLYALGMQVKGYTAATLLTDVGLSLDSRTGAYTIRNYDDSFLGPILYRNALANSRNIPAVQVLRAVGVDAAYRHFRDLGLVRRPEDPARYGLGLAIGGLYVTLADLVRAYGVLANDGREFDLRWYDSQRRPAARLIPEDLARQVTMFLSDPMARLPSFPRMGPLEYPFPVAVKTGTSKGFRDAWCVAYSRRYIVGAWVGHPDNYPMKKLAGADSAAVLVHSILDHLQPNDVSGLTDTGFPAPRGYISRRICMFTGKLATDSTPCVALEWFRPGTEPLQESRAFRRVACDRRTGNPAAPDCPREFTQERTLVALDPRFAEWARQSGIDLLPPEYSKDAPRGMRTDPKIVVKEPIDGARLLPDPESPPEYSTIRLQASVQPPTPQVVWYVDGRPWQVVDYPYSTRWPMSPGTHTFEARLPSAPVRSACVRISVAK